MNWYKSIKVAYHEDLLHDINRYGPRGEEMTPQTPHSVHTDEEIQRLQEMYPDDDLITKVRRRDRFVDQYGWSVPDLRALEKIQDFVGNDTVLEVGAGNGLWAKLLQDIGVNVIATDIIDNEQHKWKGVYTEIEPLSHLDAVRTYGNSSGVLMMSWPPYDNPMATESLRGFSGSKLIFIGEGRGGCTGSDCFFEEIYKNWQLVDEVAIPNWKGINDDLFLYERKQ